jgi:cytochrome c553
MLAAFGTATAQDSAAKLSLCQACHGVDGNARDARYPILGGQPALYTFLRIKQLKAQIEHPEMTPIARSLSDEDIQWFAEHFAKQKPQPKLARFDSARAVRGKALAAQLRCAQCHREDYSGANQMPRLAGQHVPYLLAQLQLIRENRRSDDNGNMVDMLSRIQPPDVEDLAHYFASLH